MGALPILSAIGKAKSLPGGTLGLAPLYGGDAQIYAMVQGNLVIGGLGVDAADGSKLTVNVPSSGRIAGGATVERAVNTGFATSDWLTFNLHQFDATNAKRVTDAINAAIPNSASMIDGARLAIRASGHGEDRKSVGEVQKRSLG